MLSKKRNVLRTGTRLQLLPLRKRNHSYRFVALRHGEIYRLGDIHHLNRLYCLQKTYTSKLDNLRSLNRLFVKKQSTQLAQDESPGLHTQTQLPLTVKFEQDSCKFGVHAANNTHFAEPPTSPKPWGKAVSFPGGLRLAQESELPAWQTLSFEVSVSHWLCAETGRVTPLF